MAPPAIPEPARNIFSAGSSDFLFQIQDAHLGHASGSVLREFALQSGLGDVVEEQVVKGSPRLIARDGRPVSMIAEWGYSCIRLKAEEVDGAGLPRAGFPCYSTTQGCDNPETKEEAYARLKAYFEARREKQHLPGSWLVSMTGHYFFQHYGAEWGADVLLSEVGENINSVQAHIAFTRGAARQYGRPWGIDMSAWYGPGINDYWAEEDRVWCGERDAEGNCIRWYSGAHHGHSLSLFRRIYYASYMAGAHWLLAEAGSVNFLASKHAPPSLSPLGEVAREFYAFTRAHPDRGEPYVPLGVVLDYHHGLGLSSWYNAPGQETTWDAIPLTPGDRSTIQLLEALWPGSYRVMGGDESQYMVSSPVGDTSDVLLENAPPEVLRRYETLLFSGDLHWNAAKTATLTSYLAGGKTAVFCGLPSHQRALDALSAAPTETIEGLSPEVATQTKAEAGSIILLRDASHWPDLLRHLQAKHPIRVEGDVQYLINRRGKGWILTLINNRGVTKTFHEPEKPDPAQASAVNVRWDLGTPLMVESWRSLRPLRTSKNGVELTIPPGELAVLALVPAEW